MYWGGGWSLCAREVLSFVFLLLPSTEGGDVFIYSNLVILFILLLCETFFKGTAPNMLPVAETPVLPAIRNT